MQLTNNVSGAMQTTTTDTNGNYSFTNLLPGIYVVSEDAPDTDASGAAAGAGSNAQTVTLTVGGSQTVNLGLIPINPALPVAAPFVIYAPPTNSSDTNANLEAYLRGLYNSILDRAPEAGPTALPYWENIFTDVQSG